MLGWILKVLGLVLLITVLAYLKSYQTLLKRPHKAEERIYPVSCSTEDSLAPKKALLLYQNSKHGSVRVMAEAAALQLAAQGYTVTVNHPSSALEYDLINYDALLFGTPAYLGTVAKPLIDYIRANPFVQKKVFLFVTGITPEDKREIEQLREVVPKHNQVDTVKVHKDDIDGLLKALSSSILI
jgi:hypothetical protein